MERRGRAAGGRGGGGEVVPPGMRESELIHSDEKVASRDIRVWHGAPENGP